MNTLTDRVITESGKILTSVITKEQKKYKDYDDRDRLHRQEIAIRDTLVIHIGKTESNKVLIHIGCKDDRR